jgi:hypothetical protein
MSPHFLPYIGSDYTLGIHGKRVMVLGESHYISAPEDDAPDMTQSVIEWYLNEQKSPETQGWFATYTKFIRALSGDGEIARASSAPWWKRVLFYNFVQVPLSGAREAPTTKEFRDSDSAFFEVLERYQPDRVIAWGKRLYGNLPGEEYGNNHQGPDCCGLETWIYKLRNGHEVQVIGINHPSSAFVPEEWHKVLTSFIG